MFTWRGSTIHLMLHDYFLTMTNLWKFTPVQHYIHYIGCFMTILLPEKGVCTLNIYLRGFHRMDSNNPVWLCMNEPVLPFFFKPRSVVYYYVALAWKEVRAAFAVPLFALVLISVCVGIFSFSYVCKIVFYAHMNHYFIFCVCLRLYRRVYKHPMIAITAIFNILSSLHQDWSWKLARLWLHIAHVKNTN